MFLSLFLLALCISQEESDAQQLKLVINGIRSDQGQIIVALFNSEEDFIHDQPVIRSRYVKNEMIDGTLRITLNIPPGKYGIALLDDENEDDKMTKNAIGYPKEGFGFSGYEHTGFWRPSFQAFSFIVKKNEPKTIEARIKYM